MFCMYNFAMHFDWDENKAKANYKKHKISFPEAVTAFFDEHAIIIGDPDHTIDEDRFILLGMSRDLRILIVSHCYRDQDNVIRLISARKATKSEQKQYDERL